MDATYRSHRWFYPFTVPFALFLTICLMFKYLHVLYSAEKKMGPPENLTQLKPTFEKLIELAEAFSEREILNKLL